jgi:hypothetical protein
MNAVQTVSQGFHRLLLCLSAMAAVSITFAPVAVQAKVILECVGKSQHKCQGTWGCTMGKPDCTECENCKGAQTCLCGRAAYGLH